MAVPATGQRILVVDDDREIARLVRSYLEKAGYQVLVAYDGASALHALRRDRPALVVLDLMLPDQDGWDITRTVRADPALADTPIIMLTARVDDADKIVGLELGADDYVTKPFNPREVVARVRSVLRRAQGQVATRGPRVLQQGNLLMDLDRREVLVSGQSVELTATEFSILKVLMENPGYAFTRSELIEKALGYDYEGSERTLDSHMRNLRRKIEPEPGKNTYIQTVYGVGYRLVGE
ncbi:MAG: DNA-binding response regulator [Chloroflexi bacterium]|nr:MAG: DNA-binding response regulator [Chloroflexota bacterium]